MSIRDRCASSLLVCVLAIGFLAFAPAANAASAWQAFLEPGESARNDVVLDVKHRRRGQRGKGLYLPIVPYSAYDYPYYYRRGYFPTHVGPGYIYYGRPYFYRMRYSDRCSYRHRQCVANSGHKRGPGAARRQRGACRCR